ncbi:MULTISPECIES: outer membrane lipoprotein chaperone LolA [Halomonadaceae]|uniref:Outer-membrane lipoprotein carrier protein n=1 Tax=Vreelandella titanicae TaxID=664683 RepID=A0A558JA33_9GAMM|nr:MULTISPECIES: outer membrane lipoprotein chaperone LolA [Halomonas]MBR9903040.1 outer membrane lipoprotein chaperone LolA [Gammaproteobacteria bacterium]TVU90490.1 outer membrane lipoprotein chaperone LolA [Halomonas titanicae]CEP37020.1 Outer-membrane lipoprotein carrier protein [Halomonas sp. R57-5]
MRDTQTKRPSQLAFAASALGLTFGAPAFADDAAERLTERLDPLERYQADFEQQILDGSGERMQSARGQMWLSRPGMLRWEVEAPYSQTVVSDGEDVYMYDPDLEQVTVQEMDDRVTHTPALLLSGSVDDLAESYEVFYEQDEGDDVFTLVPISADTLFEELSMVFEGEELSELWMMDSTGQRTSITFSNITLNGDIAPDMFDFEIPEGTDVIREEL